MRNTQFETSTEAIVDHIIERIGKTLFVALPLGLGKPVELVNALYARAKNDPSLQLTFLTALSLEIPQEHHPVRKRLLQPVFDRLYEGCADLSYSVALNKNELPTNIRVKEFYVRPGSRLGNTLAQQDYISSNYTHAARDVVANGCNVLLQLVAEGSSSGSSEGGQTKASDGPDLALSMSCNPDTSLEVLRLLEAEQRPHIAVAVCHPELPFMYGEAEVKAHDYDVVQRSVPNQSALFPLPRLLPADANDHMIGLLASTLIADGGSLQIGIGALGDAIAYSTALRHNNNSDYLDALQRAGITSQYSALIATCGGTTAFNKGLYGATEMMTEGFIQLMEAGVLRRQVYDFWALQQLINTGACDPERLDIGVLEGMQALGVRELRAKDFDTLQHQGLFRADARYDCGYITTGKGTRVSANMAVADSRQTLADEALGSALCNGHVLHGGFFLGSGALYKKLRDMPVNDKRRISMCGVDKINQLDHNPRLFKAQRIHARFINTGMKVTLNGAVASDTLENGQVVSGVGGQYNFVAMAHHLLTGRSILMVRAVRESASGVESNIVAHYGACTIPRHLRDIIVTEYGIADLRSKTDREVAAALIEIADARFQPGLIASAKATGKLEAGYTLPAYARNNTAAHVQEKLRPARAKGQFPAYPGGCDFTAQELQLARALKTVAGWQAGGWLTLLKALLKPVRPIPNAISLIERMGLSGALSTRDKLLKALLLRALAEEPTG